MATDKIRGKKFYGRISTRATLDARQVVAASVEWQRLGAEVYVHMYVSMLRADENIANEAQ